jgi:23S rRNA-/tRNA-specific pseudouridylate synthase
MENREVEKFYRCVVKGVPNPRQKTCRAWMKKDAAAAAVFVSDEKTKARRRLSPNTGSKRNRGIVLFLP